MKLRLSLLLLGLLAVLPFPAAAEPTIPKLPPRTLIRTLQADADFEHQTGKKGSHGWELDYKRDKVGYALAGLSDPLVLAPGAYRMTTVLRRGHYPNKGLFHTTYGLFRLEMWDVTRNERISTRELQIGDFSKPNAYGPRWVEFSMVGREGHILEPRVFWFGLGNGEIEQIRIERYADPALMALEEKARQLGQHLENNHLENGFVIARKLKNEPDEVTDAVIYTGFYAASLAWKYASTKDELTYQTLENALQTLHLTVQGNDESPLISRFVGKDGVVASRKPSKDVYTSFFLAYSIADPYIRNEPLRKQMREDVRKIALRLVTDGLRIKAGDKTLVSLTPYITDEEVRKGIKELLEDKKLQKKIHKAFKTSSRILPFYEAWPGLKDVVKAMDKGDEVKLFELVVPTLNGTFLVVERVRDMLKEQYRSDLFPRRKFRFHDLPGRQLADLLTESLKKFPPKKDGNRFARLSDMKINAASAVLSLHIIKTAAVLTKDPALIEYYQSNLYTQDALLKTALDWYSFEEEFLNLTAGNQATDQLRKGYLGALALMNLYELEKNPAVKDAYKKLLEREFAAYENEENPMMNALAAALLDRKDRVSLVMMQLEDYPLNRTGFGKDYWSKNGEKIADQYGGGENEGYSREPLPLSMRPKDSFLWQRNARRLKGDDAEKEYPGTDYLFVYWFSRAHNLIPDTPPTPTVKKK